MLDEMLQRNASNIFIFLEYENPCSFFRFSFPATLFFLLINAQVYVNIVGHSLYCEKIKVALNEK